MLYYDLFEIIFLYLEDIYDVLNFRLINKDCNENYKLYFKKIRLDIIPRSTFINLKECNVCYKKCTSVKQLIYKYDSLPHKCLIHCTNKLCYLSVIKRYLNDIKNNHIYPFYTLLKENIRLFKENNKIFYNFYLDSLKKYNGKWYIKCDNDNNSKQMFYRIKDVSYLNNLNLFSWYLDRKKIKTEILLNNN